MTNPLENHLTEAELAERLKQRVGEGSVRTLRSWRTRRVGPPWMKVGRKIIYPLSGIEPWLQSLTQQPVRSRRSAVA